MHSTTKSSNSLDSELLDQFKKVLTVLESKTVNQLTANTTRDNINIADVNQQSYRPPFQKQNRGPVNQQYSQQQQQQLLYRPKLCYNCNKPGHFSKQCRSRRNNFGNYSPNYPQQNPGNNQPNGYQTNNNSYRPYMNNYQYNNNNYEPNNQRRQSNQDRSQMEETCGICNLPGHIATSCPRNLPGTSQPNHPCQLCDNLGHSAKYCPLLKQGNCARSAQ